MMGWINLGRFAYGLLDGSKNALQHSPMEYRFLLSILLASMWCIGFGIYTAELLVIILLDISYSLPVCLLHGEYYVQ